MLHVAGFGGTTAIQTSAIAPFGIQLDPVRRIRNHQLRFHVAQQLRNHVSLGAIPANEPMSSKHPDVAEPRGRILGYRWDGVGTVVVTRIGEEVVDFTVIESG